MEDYIRAFAREIFNLAQFSQITDALVGDRCTAIRESNIMLGDIEIAVTIEPMRHQVMRQLLADHAAAAKDQYLRHTASCSNRDRPELVSFCYFGQRYRLRKP